MAKLVLNKRNPFMTTLLMIFLFFMLLLTNNVNSNSSSSSVSFSFPSFNPEQEFELGYHGDARPLDGIIQLTRRDGTTLHKHNVGRVVYRPPVQLWDSKHKVADFETEFSFVVDNTAGLPLHGDGFSFFIIPYDAEDRMPRESSGGFLGLFRPETAFDSQKNQIVAIEFDSFGNEWDPNIGPHIGIDINTLKSVKSVEWPIDYVPQGSIGKARIRYNSKAKELSVFVGYKDEPERFIVSLTHHIDLGSVLPELVKVGFSGATGDQVETHDILSWSFTSRI